MPGARVLGAGAMSRAPRLRRGATSVRGIGGPVARPPCREEYDHAGSAKDIDGKMTAAMESVSEFASVRTGRPRRRCSTRCAWIIGTLTPVNQVASISVPDARTLLIQPWEATQLAAIEKAIIKSDLGLNPAKDGKSSA